MDPVVKQDDGSVISLEVLRKKQERAALAQVKNEGPEGQSVIETVQPGGQISYVEYQSSLTTAPNGINADRFAQMDIGKPESAKSISKTQLKKRSELAPRPPPKKPVIPAGISIPEGEENWLALWDLPDDQLERRVMRERKRKAAERKALRTKQQTGKVERRVARDEKRRIYREVKLTWKAIKGKLQLLTSPITAYAKFQSANRGANKGKDKIEGYGRRGVKEDCGRCEYL